MIYIDVCRPLLLNYAPILSLPKTPVAGVTAATESEHDCG